MDIAASMTSSTHILGINAQNQTPRPAHYEEMSAGGSSPNTAGGSDSGAGGNPSSGSGNRAGQNGHDGTIEDIIIDENVRDTKPVSCLVAVFVALRRRGEQLRRLDSGCHNSLIQQYGENLPCLKPWSWA